MGARVCVRPSCASKRELGKTINGIDPTVLDRLKGRGLERRTRIVEVKSLMVANFHNLGHSKVFVDRLRNMVKAILVGW